MQIQKLNETIEQQTERERAQSMAARSKAVQDYNIMMGILEDPSEDEEGEDNE